MDDNILNNIKKMLGIPNNFEKFDVDILIHLNTISSILHQLGVDTNCEIDSSTNWNDYISNLKNLDLIKTYMYQKVRMLFDPPSGSAYVNALSTSISELEWRINNEADIQKTN